MILKELEPVKQQLLATTENVVMNLTEYLDTQLKLLKDQENSGLVAAVAEANENYKLMEKRKELLSAWNLFFLKHIKTYEIHISELSHHKEIGEDSITKVYQGIWKKKTVAIKRTLDVVNKKAATQLVEEENILR